MPTSDQGLIDIAYEEGICLTPYWDAVKVRTIGIGHTAAAGEHPDQIKQVDVTGAFVLLIRDMVKYEKPVEDLAPWATQQQRDALTSFCYNLGPGNLKQLVSGRSPAQVAAGMLAYNKGKVNGVLTTLSGLVKRRQAEQAIFLRGEYAHTDGMVPLFPVSSTGYPVYTQAKKIDARPYLAAARAIVAGQPATLLPQPTVPKPIPDEGIRLVQRGLNITYKLQPPLTEDGLYGPLTDKAVERLAARI